MYIDEKQTTVGHTESHARGEHAVAAQRTENPPALAVGSVNIEETRQRTVAIEADAWGQAYTALSKATDRDDERFDLTRREITDLSILDETEEWTDEDTGEIAVTGFDEYRVENGQLIDLPEQNDSQKVQGD